MRKRFGSTQALDDVSISLYGGEIHALLGENGAGKSTLIKIMTGVQQPDTGEMLIDGQPVRVRRSQDGQRLGVAAIYQEPIDLPGPVGRGEHLHRPPEAWPHRGPATDARARRSRCWRAWASASTSATPARGLTLAEQQTVEIAKAISLDVRVLIMDEPTASLSAHEVSQLFRIVATLRRQGVAVLFISHRMEEVFEISDRVTILRDGRWISTTPRGELTPAAAIRGMVGREVVELFHRDRQSQPGEVVLQVAGPPPRGRVHGHHVRRARGRGAGVRRPRGCAPHGRRARPVRCGARRRRHDRARRPADHDPEPAGGRRAWASPTPPRTAGSWASSSRSPSPPTSRCRRCRAILNAVGLLRRGEERETADAVPRAAAHPRAVRGHARPSPCPAATSRRSCSASGWRRGPEVLILDEPTRGIDVGAKVEVHQLVDELAAEGMAIILISSDLPEVLAMSDRILVMREGRQMGIVPRAEATQELVLAAAMGQAEPRSRGARSDAAAGALRAASTRSSGRCAAESRPRHDGLRSCAVSGPSSSASSRCSWSSSA